MNSGIGRKEGLSDITNNTDLFQETDDWIQRSIIKIPSKRLEEVSVEQLRLKKLAGSADDFISLEKFPGVGWCSPIVVAY